MATLHQHGIADEKQLNNFVVSWSNSKTMAGVLFEDIFDIKDIDPEGKKFDRG